MQKATMNLVYLSSYLPTHPRWLDSTLNALGYRDQWDINDLLLEGAGEGQKGQALVLFLLL